MAETKCRNFNGYKPCGKHTDCSEACPERDLVETSILIVHLEALGAVLRSTALLPAIKRKYPRSRLTWVTQAPADAFLANHPLIDQVLTTKDFLRLAGTEFDVSLCLDKSQLACGLVNLTRSKNVLGFRMDSTSGAIVPANAPAKELWELGLDDHAKFFVNQKTELELVHQALELGPYRRDEYQLVLSADEKRKALARKAEWQERPGQLLVGINTGCSSSIQYRKLSVSFHREMVQALSALGYRVILLGGPDEKKRNERIGYGLKAVQSPTRRGLRDGLISVEACDLIVTGDSLGLHMGVALKKWTVAWFGPTCPQEIELYGRGVKVLSQAQCSPCWKRSCQKTPMCYDLVDLQELLSGIEKGRKWATSSSRQHSSEMHFSPSL